MHKFKVKPIQTKVCMGYNSICSDDKHVLLLDYDVPKVRLKQIEENLYYITKKYNISTFYIIDSKNGYNAVSLSKMSLTDIMRVRNKCKYADKLHNKIGYKRRGWVLRIGEDKKPISIIVNNDSIIQKSNAHRILLHSYYDIKVKKDNTFDDYDTILFEKYVSKKVQ